MLDKKTKKKLLDYMNNIAEEELKEEVEENEGE